MVLLCRLGFVLVLVLTAAASPLSTTPPNRLDRMTDSTTFGGGLGVNIHFTGHHPDEVAAIARTGFHLIRSDLLWAHVEHVRGQYDWRPYDALIADLRAAHIVPVMILDYSNPLYAARLFNHPLSDSLGFQAPMDGSARDAFMAFARAAAGRYGKDIIWEIWNEPDHNFGDPVDLRRFVGFALDACRAVRSAAPEAAIMGPAASGFVWWFLAALHKADTAGCLDAISVHPYRDEPPESVLRDWARAQQMTATCASGAPCPALADSEWGYSVTGGAWSAARQSDYVVRLRLLDMIAGVKLTIVYDWKNDGPDPADKEANFGLLDASGQPKPVFHAVSGMAAALGDLRYLGQVQADRPGDFIVSFGRDGRPVKLAGWSAASTPLAYPVCGAEVRSPGETAVEACAPPMKPARLLLTGKPAVIGVADETTMQTQQRVP